MITEVTGSSEYSIFQSKREALILVKHQLLCGRGSRAHLRSLNGSALADKAANRLNIKLATHPEISSFPS